jgi:hypothetical protein
VKRTIVMALSVVLALIVAAPMAVAARQEPAQEPPLPVKGSQVLPAGAVFGNCDFPILFELSGKAQTLLAVAKRVNVLSRLPKTFATRCSRWAPRRLQGRGLGRSPRTLVPEGEQPLDVLTGGDQ